MKISPLPIRLLLLALTLAAPLRAAPRLGVVTDDSAPAQQAFAAAVAAELGAGTTVVAVKPADLVALEQSAPGLDAVLVTGVGALETALGLREPKVPVVVAGWHEAAFESVVAARGVSVVGPRGFAARDLALLRKAVPFPLVQVVVDEGLVTLRKTETEAWRARLAGGLLAKVELVPLESDTEPALHQIGFLSEAVYLTPGDHCSPLTWTLFIKRLQARRIPTASLAGAPDVELGVRHGARENVIARLSAATAAALRARLDGQPATLTWVEPMGDWQAAPAAEGPPSVPATVVIPSPTPPPPDPAAVAEITTPPVPAPEPPPAAPANSAPVPPSFVAPPPEPAPEPAAAPPRPLDLADILDLALRHNPRYLAGKAGTRAAQEAGQEALGPLLPQVEGGYEYRQVDEDRAATSEGNLAESRTTLGVRIHQTLFSDQQITDLRVARKDAARRLHELDGEALDLLVETSTRYYEFLTQTRLLELAQKHLADLEKASDAARRRAGRGEGAAGEEARWETEVTRARRAVLETQSARDRARVSLNILMGDRALSAAPVVVSGLAGEFPVLGGQLDAMLDHPSAWDILRGYSVSVGLVNAPELKAAARRQESAQLEKEHSQRSFFTPDVRASFASAQELDADYPDGNEGRDKEDWEIRLTASLPLFNGGRNVNRYQREAAELDKSKRELEAARAGIEERCHHAVLALRSAWPGLRLQSRAAETARAGADRALADYTEGRAGLLNLLDALDSSRREENAAAWAWFQLQQRAAQWQRSMAWFELTRSRDDRNAFIAGLELRLRP